MMVDANERCDAAGAKQLLLLALDQTLPFVEEPLPAHALSAYREASLMTSERDYEESVVDVRCRKGQSLSILGGLSVRCLCRPGAELP
jgi:hypothetical protein